MSSRGVPDEVLKQEDRWGVQCGKNDGIRLGKEAEIQHDKCQGMVERDHSTRGRSGSSGSMLNLALCPRCHPVLPMSAVRTHPEGMPSEQKMLNTLPVSPDSEMCQQEKNNIPVTLKCVNCTREHATNSTGCCIFRHQPNTRSEDKGRPSTRTQPNQQSHSEFTDKWHTSMVSEPCWATQGPTSSGTHDHHDSEHLERASRGGGSDGPRGIQCLYVVCEYT